MSAKTKFMQYIRNLCLCVCVLCVCVCVCVSGVGFQTTPYISHRQGVPEITLLVCLFVCVEVLRPSQPNGVMSSAISLPNHTFIGQA